MRVLIVLTMTMMMTIAGLCFGTAAASDTPTGADKAAPCLGCHNAVVSLKGRGADVIEAQMKAIRDGDAPHPPGLAGLADDDIEAIAAWLDGV